MANTYEISHNSGCRSVLERRRLRVGVPREKVIHLVESEFGGPAMLSYCARDFTRQ